MKKIKDIKKWWKATQKKPITWGDYAKLVKWSFGFLGIFYLAVFIWYKITLAKEKKQNQQDDD